ncbi:MAG: DEAD/DEAH box helicase [Clostridiales bacterium GWF2_36_10]|nr:MAG: DEAD/DEAH box helicase [Clostridiales bacterium GWF2_36_10]HAN21990.1 ATP-dependent helicase [Clostridiales bacterium]
MSKFEELGVSQPILKALEEMGFETPTEVQSRAIPHILNKEDLIVMSKTGSGKTAVFGIPLLQLTDSKTQGPQCLILTPTRELAVQIDNDIKLISKHLSHKTAAVYGQHNINSEIQVLNKGVTILTGTPGRVYDHIEHNNFKTDNIRFLVLDEADRMLDMGFIDQIKRIIKHLPQNRVTLLFSATMPTEIRRICTSYMKNPVTIEIASQTMTVDTIDQAYYKVTRNEKCTYLNNLLMIKQPESCIIFCNTRIAVDMVHNYLVKKGYSCQALHGDIPQSKRMQTIQHFKQDKFHILVATDVAARGLHIEDLSLVINYDIPDEKDSYVHRIGRTGRAGKGGQAISFVTSNEIMGLYEIEEHIGVMISEAELPTVEEVNAKKDSFEKWKKTKEFKPLPTVIVDKSRETNKTTHRQSNRQNTNKPTNNKPNYNRPNNNYTRPKPSYTNPKPIIPNIPEVKAPIIEKQEIKKNKSFLKRIFERMLGKKD